jgi:hypothetical protein
MDLVVDFWKNQTAQQKLIAYWKKISQIEGKIDRNYFSTGHGKHLLRELSDPNREMVISILCEVQVPKIHLAELNKITMKRDSWTINGTKFTGLYDEDTRTIYLKPDRDFKATLLHELGHFFTHRFLRGKVALDWEKPGELIADIFERLHNAPPGEKENIKRFLGI